MPRHAYEATTLSRQYQAAPYCWVVWEVVLSQRTNAKVNENMLNMFKTRYEYSAWIVFLFEASVDSRC